MMFTFSWGAYDHVRYFPILLIAFGVLCYKVHKIVRARRILAGSQHTHLMVGRRMWRSYMQLVCMSFGLLFLFLTTLQPEGVQGEDTVQQKGRDLFIALDVSRSMLATDIKPNRLACAKKKIKELVKNLSCERVGLLLFSGSAFVQCPLTADYAAFYMFLEHVDVETISSGTTALDHAITKAVQAFASMPDKKNKLLVLFTDGEDFSRNLDRVKTEASHAGMRIFTVGVGSEHGAPVPLFDAHGNAAGHQRDQAGNVVISRLNDATLRSVSQDVGGAYVRVTQDSTDVLSVAHQVQKFEKEELGAKTFTRMEQYYPYFLMVSFVCFLSEWLL